MEPILIYSAHQRRTAPRCTHNVGRLLLAWTFVVGLFVAFSVGPAFGATHRTYTRSIHTNTKGRVALFYPTKFDVNDTQILEAINRVRERFGLPRGIATGFGRSSVLNGATSGRDPAFVPMGNRPVVEYGLWGGVYGTSHMGAQLVNTVVNAWVYRDGWYGTATENIECTFPKASGCYGHRRSILSRPPFPGMRLYVDAASVPLTVDGIPETSISVLLIWVVPAR